jgi:hypothetical protein
MLSAKFTVPGNRRFCITVRQVIAVDLQAHGRIADIDRPLSYETTCRLKER